MPQEPENQRELEARIRRLCASALSAEGPEFASLLTGLRAALLEHHLELENVITDFLLRLSAKSGRNGPQPTDCQKPATSGVAMPAPLR